MTAISKYSDLYDSMCDDLGLAEGRTEVRILPMKGDTQPIEGVFMRLATWYTLHDCMPIALVIKANGQGGVLGATEVLVPWHNVAKLVVIPTMPPKETTQ